MEAYSTPKREVNELEVTGISRSGRVRKKSSKLMDFESSSNIIETKVKKTKLQSPQEQSKKKRLPTDSQAQSPVPQVTQTIHVAQIHYPPPNKLTISSPTKKSPKLPATPVQKKKKIESSSDYETQSQSTNSESDDDEISKTLHIAEFNNTAGMNLDSLEPADDEIISTKKKMSTLKKPKKNITPPKQDIKLNKTKAVVLQKPKTRYTAYMLWSKEMRQELLKECPTMDFTAISKRLGELWATVPNMEKYNWSNRAKRLSEKNLMIPSSKKFITKASPIKSTPSDSLKKKTNSFKLSDVTKSSSHIIARTGKDATRDPTKEMRNFRAIELQPIDVAAYLKLLGESLTVIGERLKEHNGQITVSGSLSVLLDSLLCALGSLICLTQQVPEIGTQNSTSLSKTLENIAYIMPGL